MQGYTVEKQYEVLGKTDGDARDMYCSELQVNKIYTWNHKNVA